MKIWKISFFATLLALIVTNAFWLFAVIDSGVTYTYQQVSLDDKEKAVDMLGALIVTGGQKYTKKDVLHILRQANKEAFIVEEENLIDVEGVKFIFKNGKLSVIRGKGMKRITNRPRPTRESFAALRGEFLGRAARLKR